MPTRRPRTGTRSPRSTIPARATALRARTAETRAARRPSPERTARGRSRTRARRNAPGAPAGSPRWGAASRAPSSEVIEPARGARKRLARRAEQRDLRRSADHASDPSHRDRGRLPGGLDLGAPRCGRGEDELVVVAAGEEAFTGERTVRAGTQRCRPRQRCEVHLGTDPRLLEDVTEIGE